MASPREPDRPAAHRLIGPALVRAAPRVALAVLAAVGVSAIAWAVYGSTAFVHCLVLFAPLGAVTTVVADLLAAQPAWLGGLRRQIAVLAALTVAQLAVGVALFADLMFVSSHDAVFMALVVAYTGLVGLLAARRVTRRAMSDVDAVRAALAEVGEGSRDVRIPVRGRDELAALAADVEAMVAKLSSAERARRELVVAVSHDLRTPLTAIRLISQGLEDGIFEPDRTREQLALISTHVRTLGALIDDLFELSRLEAGELIWSMEHVRLDELLLETVDAMRPQAEAGGVEVRAELDGALTPARANPEQLQRVLFNLIQNAIRHTPADGSVVVRAELVPGPPGPALEIEVADSGEGIDPDVRDRIFEPFVQGTSRAARTDGSAGLGLAIARAIVEAHGGRIWLADTTTGTRVRFSLPAAA
jgi:signal transduction histidine kinase